MENFGELVTVNVGRNRNSIIITWKTNDGKSFTGVIGMNVHKGNNVITFNLSTVLRMIVEKCTDVANKNDNIIKNVCFYMNIPVISWKGFMDEIEANKDTDLFYIIQLSQTLGLSKDTLNHCNAQKITETEYNSLKNKRTVTLGKRNRY